MKRLAYLTTAALSAIFLLAACSSDKKEDPIPEEPKSNDCSLKDISAYAESVDRGQDVLDVDISSDGLIITLTAPETYDNQAPVDPTKVHVTAKAAETAKVSIAATDVIDLSTDKKFTITAEDGTTTKDYTLTFKQTPQLKYIPKVSATASVAWKIQGDALHRSYPAYATGIAVNDKYVFALDGWVLSGASKTDGSLIHVYDRATGNFVKTIDKYVGANEVSSETCVIAMDVDDAGNFMTGKFNWNSGVGCRVDYYTGIDATPGYAMHIDRPGCSQTELPLDMGRQMTVVGDITKNAIVIYTTGGWGGFEARPAQYAVCTIKNGEIDGKPEINSALGDTDASDPSKGVWSNAIVQRESLESGTLYIGYNDYDIEPYPDPEKYTTFAHFLIRTPGKQEVEMNQQCFRARLLDMKVFKAGDCLLLATLEQNWAANSEFYTRVYNISDTDLLPTVTPDSEDYLDVLLFEDTYEAITNSGRYGRIDAEYHDGAAYVYSYLPADGSIPSRIICHKLVLTSKN